MAELPNTYARRPTPRFGGVDRANPVVESGDIAIGRGIQGFAQGMGQFLAKAKADADKDQLDDYTLRAKDRARILKQEYEQVRGRDASQSKDYYMNTVGGYNEMRDELLGEISDTGVHKDLEQRLELGRINFMEGFINHVHHQGEIYHAQVVEGKIKNGAADMADNFKDEGQLQQDYDLLMEGINDLAKMQGIPINKEDPAYQNLLRENLTPAHISVIKAWVKDDNPDEAKAYFTEYSDQISGEKHADIKELIEESDNLTGAQDFLAEMRSLGKDIPEMQDIARNRFKGNAETAALAQIAAYEREEDKESRGVESVASDVIYDAWNERGDMSLEDFKAANLTALRDMNPKERAAFEKWAYAEEHGKTIKTDIGTYFDLLNRIQAGEKFSLTEYQPYISVPHLMSLRTEMDKDPKLLRTKTQMISDGLTDIGFEASDLTGDPDDADTKKAQLYRLWIENGLPRDWSEKDLAVLIEQANTKIVTDKAWWGKAARFLGDKVNGDWDIGDITTYAYETEVPGVPPEQLPVLADQLTDIGVKVTPTNLKWAESLRVAGEPITAANIERYKKALAPPEVIPEPGDRVGRYGVRSD